MKPFHLNNLLLTTALCALAGACGGETVETPTPTTPAAVEDPAVDASSDLFALLDNHAAALAQIAPELATELGLDETIAGEGYLGQLSGYGFEAQQSARALNEQFLQDIRAQNRDALSGTALVSHDVLVNAYTTAAKRNAFNFGGATPVGSGLPNAGSSWATSPYFVTQLTGPHIHLPRMLQTEQPLANATDVDNYLARLEAIGPALDGVVETLGADAAVGVVPPRFVINGAIGVVDALIEPAPTAQPVVTTLMTKTAALETFPVDQREASAARAAKLVETVVYPAYGRLRNQLETMLQQSDDNAGVWRLGEEGEAFYQMALNAYGAQGMTGDEVHELGLSEVARIHEEMDAILKTLDLTDGPVGARMQALAERPDNLYPNTDDGREALLASLREQVAEILERAPQWFERLPEQAVEVRRIPVYEQDSSPGGYYSGPSLDGARPGIYWINLKDTADNAKHGLKTLTYHEAVPGHHFSISYQQSDPDMPLMRKMVGYSQFEEGWALYAEKLAKEMGMYEGDPAGDLGRLQAELFRAARLVVDSGLHAKRWTREEAIDYMVGATGETRASVTREVERYAAVPGQACSYKLGMLAIERMRAKAEAELGDAFDIRAFHEVILTTGSSPMEVLSARVEGWIDSQKG